MCEYKLNRQNKGFALLKSLLKHEKNIISYSNYINELKKYDNRILPYLKSTLGEKKYMELMELIKKNDNRIEQDKIRFRRTNKILKDYFKQ